MKNIIAIILRNSVEYFKKSKGLGILEQIIAVFRALSWVLGIFVTQKLFDTITNLREKSKIIYYLGFLTIVIIMQQILNGVGQYLFSKVSYSNMGMFMVEFQKKLGKISAENFEDTKFLDNVNKAKECLEYESLGHFASICLQVITYYLVFFLSTGGYLFLLSPILLVLILIAFIPAFFSQVVQARIFVELEEENAPLRRKYEYYKKTITGREFYKETRLLGGFNFFYKLFTNTLKAITQKTWKTKCKIFMLHFLLDIVTFIGLGISIFILFRLVMVGDISVGMFVSVFVALSQIFAIVEEIVSEHLSKGSEILGQVANFYKLMDMSEVIGEEKETDFTKGIVAKNVDFTYPMRDEKALNDITLTIKKGETVAIVGENGAGKSTLVRVLTGLYTPKLGEVYIGGIDTKLAHSNSIFKKVSGVFQHFQRYKMTLAENVSISDTKTMVDTDRVKLSLKESEFNNEKIKLDTMLSPEFNGVDLSGGQWQRVAIARGIYRKNEFIVLDEPTAAIDPIEEARLYNQFRNLTKGKCAILVTHRLGSVKLAEKIVVMDRGKIKEFGTHEELIAQRGKYYKMWIAQAKWYENRKLE